MKEQSYRTYVSEQESQTEDLPIAVIHMMESESVRVIVDRDEARTTHTWSCT